MQPNRRTFELMVVVGVLLHFPVGMVRLWAAKTFQDSAPGSPSHAVAEVATVVLG
jgi:hypothetical protein